MSLAEKVETLRTQLGLEEGPIFAIIEKASLELRLDIGGMGLMDKADACLAQLEMGATAPMGAVVEAEFVTDMRPPEAEMRAERAEAELRAREAEMRARAAEEALARQLREEAEAKARREAEAKARREAEAAARREAEKLARKVKPVAAVPASQVRARSSPNSPDIAQQVRDRGHLHFHAASAYSQSLSEDNRVAAANGCKFVYCCCCPKVPCGAVYNCASSECVCSPFISCWIFYPFVSFVRCEGCDAQTLGAKQGHPAELGAWYSEGAYMFVVSAERGTLAVYPGDCLQAPCYWCEDVSWQCTD